MITLFKVHIQMYSVPNVLQRKLTKSKLIAYTILKDVMTFLLQISMKFPKY